MKKCNKCGKRKSLTEFSKKRKSKDGYQSHCKFCKSDYNDSWYLKNKVSRRTQALERFLIVVQESRNNLIQYLKQHPCVDCGETDPIVLQFDHVKGKKNYNISTMICSCYLWKTILKEIEKCEVRCANCHLKVTAKRAGYFKIDLILADGAIGSTSLSESENLGPSPSQPAI